MNKAIIGLMFGGFLVGFIFDNKLIITVFLLLCLLIGWNHGLKQCKQKKSV